jgi:hypothetical protein
VYPSRPLHNNRFCASTRDPGQDALIYLVLAEYRLILFEAKAQQPACHVHDDAQTKL